jgi:hypothetical protein
LKAKKLLALFLAATMVFTLVACGGGGETTPTPTPPAETPTVTVDPTPITPEMPVLESSIDFEDGNYGFAMIYNGGPLASPAELAVVEWNGSKALQVTNTGGGGRVYVAFDVSSILGADITKVASAEMTIGTAHDGGAFSAVSGQIQSWTGENLDPVSSTWSVYLPSKNPSIVTSTAMDGLFVANANNILIVALTDDNGPGDGNGDATFYIDNIRFLDGAGNALTGDTSVAFNPPEGFIPPEGLDPNLFCLADVYEVPSFAVSNTAWSQSGVAMTDEMREALGPGTVIEVSFDCAAPIWLVANGGAPNGDWIRGGTDPDNDYTSLGYISEDRTTIQFTYEQLTAQWGEDWHLTLNELQAEGREDWQVFGVKIGKDSGFAVLGNVYEVPGFTVANTAWSQSGVAMTDEMREALGPGTIIEVSFDCAAPIWLVANGGAPNGDWIRGGTDPDNDYECLGFLSEDGASIQFAYEQLAEQWGEDWHLTLNELQVEGREDWTAYSVSIGKPFQRMMNKTLIEGFAPANDGWAQAGMEADNFRKFLVPGAVFDIYYESAGTVWFVANGGAPNGDWLRGVPGGDTGLSFGIGADGMIQFTYDSLTPEWGEGWGETLRELQVESSDTWTVYSMYAGYLYY